MKNVLLLCPFFMGYNVKIAEELSKEYYVTMCDNQLKLDLIQANLSNGKVARALRNHCRLYKKVSYDFAMAKITDQYIEEFQINANQYDIIICINGHYMPDKFYRVLKEKNKKASFILYLWDDIANLTKHNHLKYFDHCFSYNIMDCRKYNLKYLPVFVQSSKIGHSSNNLYDIAVIASAKKERIDFVKKLYYKYKNQYRFFVYFSQIPVVDDFFCYNHPMDYAEYLDLLRKSEIVLDIPYSKQKGPTTRIFDSLLTKTKVITTQELSEYPVFSENIYKIDMDNPVIPSEFMKKEFVEIAYKPLNISEWINAILEDVRNT